MTEFLEALNGFYTNVGEDDDNDTATSTTCHTKIPTSDFHVYLLLPSLLMMFLMACTISRKNKWLACCWGRPGAVFPMDILGKSHRFSYAAAWCSIAFLAEEMVFGSNVIVDLQGPAYVTVFNKVLSMLMIGIDYFPMFAGLALQSVTGYMVGTAYAWLLLTVSIFRETECDFVVQTRLILILRDLPNLLCLGYLSISLPLRTIQSLRHKTIRVISSSEVVSVLNMVKETESSPESVHVRHLLRPIPPQPPPPTSVLGKVIGVVKAFVSAWIYHNKKKFRYSARILSVMFMGLMLIYKVTLEVTVFVLSIFVLVETGFQKTLTAIGWYDAYGEDPTVKEIRDYTYLMYYLLINARICFIVAISLACAGSILTILHMLSSYRTNLFDLYRGDNTHIPHRSTRSNASLLVGSMRYAGYQVAYIAWGFVLHFLVLLLICLAICTVITMIQHGFYQWILVLLMRSWPAILMTVVIMLTQTLLSKFAFLQDAGESLAIDNRRMLFSFTFFMFFYNIFVGFLSCLLRIIKSIIIGTIFLPRLDNSALPRRFQMFDPGFANYCGFIHVECAHTHPVMIMFLRMLLIGNETRKSEKDPESDQIVVDMNGKGGKSKEKPKTVYVRARTRWFLLYTLHSNPSVRVHRKGYIQYMNVMQERLAKRYCLNKTAIGNLIKHMNHAVTNSGSADIDDISVEVPHSTRDARANWNALFGMNSFLKQIQKDMAIKHGMFVGHADTPRVDMVSAAETNAGYNTDNKVNDGGGVITVDGNASSTNVLVKTPNNTWQRAAMSSLTNNVADTKL